MTRRRSARYVKLKLHDNILEQPNILIREERGWVAAVVIEEDGVAKLVDGFGWIKEEVRVLVGAGSVVALVLLKRQAAFAGLGRDGARSQSLLCHEARSLGLMWQCGLRCREGGEAPRLL